MNLYEQYKNDESLEYLDLSASDFAWIAVEFISNGGGDTDDFWHWLSSLTYEEAREIVYG